MKSQPSLLSVFLTIFFAVALSLTLTLICVSCYQEGNTPVFPQGGGSSSRTPSSTAFSTPSSVTPETTSPQPTEAPTTTSQETTQATDVTTTPTTASTPAVSTTAASIQLPTSVLPDVSNGLAFESIGGGNCRVVGIGSCTDACVVIPSYSPTGERVVEIAEKAFYASPTVAAVQIPETVISIGALAFAACERLVYLSVDPDNRYYCDVDGILYSAGCTTLILYPPMRAGERITLHSVTTRIMDMAFYACPYLKSVHYAGSLEDWDNVIVGSKNYSLIAASMSFEKE